MDASFLNTNFEDFTPGGNFDISWTETQGGINLYFHVVEDGETHTNYLILIEETFEDTKPGLTYSRGWSVPVNLRLNSKCQFTIQQKRDFKVLNFPESSTFVLTNSATIRTETAPSILPTCSGNQINCLPPITSSTHLTEIVTPTSAVPGFTTPVPVRPSRDIPLVGAGTPISATPGSLTSNFASNPSTSHSLVSTSGVKSRASLSSSSAPSATPTSQIMKKNTVIAIGVGTGAGILAFFFLVFFLRYRHRKRHSPFKTKEVKTSTVSPSIGDPKFFPNKTLQDTLMDSSAVTRKDAFSIYGSLEENNRTGGGMINGTVRRPSQMMTTSERGLGVRGYGDEAGKRSRELSDYESLYSQDSMMGKVGVGQRAQGSFDGRVETSFGGFI